MDCNRVDLEAGSEALDIVSRVIGGLWTMRLGNSGLAGWRRICGIHWKWERQHEGDVKTVDP
jgi:hypothetical protein